MPFLEPKVKHSEAVQLGRKAQHWYPDLILGLFIFSVAVLVFFQYMNNTSNNEEQVLDNIIIDGKIISNMLLQQGHPVNWTQNNVERIGISTGNSELNTSKLILFKNLTEKNYSKTKTLLGTSYNYGIIFLNTSGDPRWIGGYTFGSPEFNVSISTSGRMMHDKVNDNDLSFEMNRISLSTGITLLPSNFHTVNQFIFGVIEDPNSPSNADNFFEDIYNGSFVFIDERIIDRTAVAPFIPGTDTFGILGYVHVWDENIKNVSATVVENDDYLDLSIGQKIICPTYRAMNNTKTNESGWDFDAIAKYDTGEAAIARWR